MASERYKTTPFLLNWFIIGILLYYIIIKDILSVSMYYHIVSILFSYIFSFISHNRDRTKLIERNYNIVNIRYPSYNSLELNAYEFRGEPSSTVYFQFTGSKLESYTIHRERYDALEQRHDKWLCMTSKYGKDKSLSFGGIYKAQCVAIYL